MKSNLILDIGIGLVAGLLATKVTEYAQKALWAATPEKTRQREQRVRPGPPYRVAAEKSASLANLELDKQDTKRLGKAFHYASGIGWGPVYCLLGMSMSLILDEFLTPALGFSAPDEDYPAAAHVRGLLGHLVYGLAVAGTAEGLYRLTPALAGQNRLN